MGDTELSKAAAYGLRLAEAHFRRNGRLDLLVHIEGEAGTATVRLDLSCPAGRTRTIEKARLMSVAVDAQACTIVFASRLVGPQPHTDVVMALARSPDGSHAMLARIERDPRGKVTALRAISTPLTQAGDGELDSLFAPLFPEAAPTDGERADAWLSLEAMGVRALGRRLVLH